MHAAPALPLNDLLWTIAYAVCPIPYAAHHTMLAATVTLPTLAAHARRLAPIHAVAFAALVDDMADELCREVEPGEPFSPYLAPLTLACVWDDLCRLAGVRPAPAVAALIAGERVERVILH